MNPDTLQALKESIAHWERLATGNRLPNERVGRLDCALCQKFNTLEAMYYCEGCPVKEKTGRVFCLETPFIDVDTYLCDSENKSLNTDKFKELAQKELDFLKSLLPTETE